MRATGGMTLASRVGGLVRDVIVGRIFGDTAIGSAFASGFAIPNTFRRLFGEGALTAAFIPAYTELHKSDPKAADKLASLTVAVLGLVTGAITLGIEIVLLAVILAAPQDADRALSLKLMMVMLPFMPLICVVAILAGMLQVHGRFGTAASGPVILNTFIVGVGAWCLFTGRLAGENVAYLLGLATVLSGATQCLWFAWILRGEVEWTRAWEEAKPRAREVLKKFIPAAVGLGTLQVNAYVDQLITMWPIWVGPTILGHSYPLTKASGIIIALTTRLYQFPLGVFGIAIASAVFPLLARHADEPDHFIDTLRRGLRMSLFIGLPATVGLMLVREDAVAVLFGHGKTGWSRESLGASADVLFGFAAGVWAYSLNHVLTRAFYACKDTRTPMRVALAMVGLNFVLNVTLIWRLREAGLAWSTAIAAIVQTFVLGILVRRMLIARGMHGGRGEGLFDAHAWRAVVKIVAASGVMGGVVLLVMHWVPGGGGSDSPLTGSGLWPGLRSEWTWQLVRVGIACGVGGGSYVIAARVLGLAELRWLMHRGGGKAVDGE